MWGKKRTLRLTKVKTKKVTLLGEPPSGNGGKNQRKDKAGDNTRNKKERFSDQKEARNQYALAWDQISP